MDEFPITARVHGTDTVLIELAKHLRKSDQLDSIRATLLVNWGPHGHIIPGLVKETEEPLVGLLNVTQAYHKQIQRLKALLTAFEINETKKPDDEKTSPPLDEKRSSGA